MSTQRQAAQNDLRSAITTLNSTLATIGQLSNQIVALQPSNQSTADLQNQRNAAVQTLSQLLQHPRPWHNPTATCRCSPPAA